MTSNSLGGPLDEGDASEVIFTFVEFGADKRFARSDGECVFAAELGPFGERVNYDSVVIVENEFLDDCSVRLLVHDDLSNFVMLVEFVRLFAVEAASLASRAITQREAEYVGLFVVIAPVDS